MTNDHDQDNYKPIWKVMQTDWPSPQKWENGYYTSDSTSGSSRYYYKRKYREEHEREQVAKPIREVTGCMNCGREYVKEGEAGLWKAADGTDVEYYTIGDDLSTNICNLRQTGILCRDCFNNLHEHSKAVHLRIGASLFKCRMTNSYVFAVDGAYRPYVLSNYSVEIKLLLKKVMSVEGW